jgi:hypothetical protein
VTEPVTDYVEDKYIDIPTGQLDPKAQNGPIDTKTTNLGVVTVI